MMTIQYMKVYKLKDYTGSESTHLAINKDSAIQAHLQHYGLLSLPGDIHVIEEIELKDLKDRSTICWEPLCVLVGATNYKET